MKPPKHKPYKSYNNHGAQPDRSSWKDNYADKGRQWTYSKGSQQHVYDFVGI